MLSLKTRANYHTLLDAAALQEGNEITVIYIETSTAPKNISRSTFLSMSLNYTSILRDAGIKAGDLVIIAHTQPLESIYAFWGALLIGAIPSMFPTLTEKLDPNIYMQNLSKLVQFSGVKAIITNDDFAKKLASAVNCEVIVPSTESYREDETSYTPIPESVAFLQHSSGTTGLQKGVALSHEAVLNQLAAYGDAIQLSSNDVIVSWLPLYHDMGLIAGFLLPLIQGIPLVLMSPFDWIAHPAMLLQAIHSYKGTLCWLPNFAYNHMARRIRTRDLDDISLQSMRAFINCSEPVRHDSHQKFLERFQDYGSSEEQFAVSYAMAENTFAVTQSTIGKYPKLDTINPRLLQEKQLAHPDNDGISVVSCGKVIHNTEIQVMDEQKNPISERHVGEIFIRSNCMLSEYHNRPDLQPLVNDWYCTGDMGYIAEGEVYIIGRKKDLIIHAGKNVYPQDIEAIVNTVDGIHKGRCVVFGIPDEREGTELIVAIAEVDTNIQINEQKLKKTIRQRIVRHSAVSAAYVTIVESKWIIKTSSGKIARDANRRKWEQEFGIHR